MQLRVRFGPHGLSPSRTACAATKAGTETTQGVSVEISTRGRWTVRAPVWFIRRVFAAEVLASIPEVGTDADFERVQATRDAPDVSG